MNNYIDQGQDQSQEEAYQLEKSSPRRWLIIFLLFIAVIITLSDRINLSVAAPVMMKEFGWSPAVMGMALSAFGWTYALLQIPSGYYCHKFGLRKGFGISFTGWGIVTILTSTVTGITSLTFWRSLLGVAEAPLWPGLVRVLSIWFNTKERAFAMSFIGVATSLGLAFGTWITTQLILHFGWRMMYIFIGVFSIIIVPLWVYFYKGLSPELTSNEKQTEKVVRWYTLCKNRNVLSLAVSYFCASYSMYLFLTWLPTYFSQMWGFSLQKTGTFAAVVFAASIIGKPVIGWLAGYLINIGWSVTRSRKVMLVVLSLAGGSILLVNFAPIPTVAAVFLVISEITSQSTGPLIWATAADIAPASLSAQVGGILNFAAGIAGIVAPIATGFLLTATGSFHWPMIVAAALMVLAALNIIFVLGKIEPLKL